MKKQLFILGLIFCTVTLIVSRSAAQNVTVNLQKVVSSGYNTDFTKSFNVSFTNTQKTDKVKVIITMVDGTPAILTDAANPNGYKIDFTALADGTLAFKDKAGKTQKIKTDKLQIKLGDQAIIINNNKKTTPNLPATKNKDIVVDYAKPLAKYEADFTEDFKITFSNTPAAKVKVSIATQKPALNEVLSAAEDLSAYEIKFTNDKSSGLLLVADAEGADIKVEAEAFTISVGKKSFTVAKTASKAETDVVKKEAEEEGKKVPYWSYLAGNDLKFSLDRFRILPRGITNCCDNCTDCDDDAFKDNNQIIYDARSGLTYYVPADKGISGRLCGSDITNYYNPYKVTRKNQIRVSAGDPLVYIIENANPALYNIELSDSGFLTNNETTALLESLLLQKAENPLSQADDPAIHGGTDKEIHENKDEKTYLAVKTGLLIVRAEMWMLLENYRRSSPYLHNCIQLQKRLALAEIDAYPKTLLRGAYQDFTFIQLVDAFLNQETEDSILNQQIKALYGEFVAASYKIAYRYPRVPEQDILNFKLSITAKPNSPYPGLLNVQMKHSTQAVYVKNFFKVDVSSGLYMGFMKDRTYTLQSDTLSVRNAANTGDSLTNIKRIVQEDNGKNEIGFASFLHLYYKYSTWFNIGGVLGAGLSFDKTIRPRYFTGVSLMLGTNNRVCINGGVVWGNYEDLSSQYKKTGNNYNILKESESSLNYATRFKHTGFISLSYNLPFLVRKSKTEAKPKDNTDNSSGSDKKKE